MRMFEMYRESDESGVSGTGKVLEGVVFKGGTTVVRWLSPNPSTTIFNTFSSFESIHITPHPTNNTKIKWLDEGNKLPSIISDKTWFCPNCGCKMVLAGDRLLCAKCEVAMTAERNGAVVEFELIYVGD